MAGSSPGHLDDINREHASKAEQPQLYEPNSANSSGNGVREEGNVALTPQSPAPGFIASLWSKLGLDAPTLLAMFKGALAPVVGLAIYQSDAVAAEFSTFGYLVGIVAVLSLSVLPRGKFVQTLIFNLLFLSVGSAVALLILWSALQARLNTQTMPDDPRSPPTYNSSQSAVSAVWLFANIWIVNTIRAKFPSLNVPVIVYSIITNISCTFSPQITSNAAFQSIIRRLLTAMLTGFAIAAATCLLIVPVPSRAVWAAQLKGLLNLLRGAVKQEKAYLQSLEREDMFAVPADICAATHLSDSDTSSVDSVSQEKRKGKRNAVKPAPRSTSEAKAIKETMFNLRLLSSKIYVDLPFAKRDFAWDKLAAKDLSTVMELFRGVVIPIHGIGTVIDIFQRLAEKRGWITTSETPLEVLAEKNEDKRVWNEVMKQLHEPFEKLSAAIDEGLQHAGLLLEILPRPKAPKNEDGGDVESRGGLIQPGDPGFVEVLKGKIQSFHDIRGTILCAWAKEKGLVTDGLTLDEIKNIPFSPMDTRHRHDQEQLYVLLYIETLMEAAGEGVLRIVQFADLKVADGAMSHKRLIIPKPKVLRKWVMSVFSDEDKGQENNADMMDSGMSIIYLGDSFAQKKDPEHLPPTSSWQRTGNGLRAISKFFSSEESAFGFRCACATLTVGIIAFLEKTHVFFQEQRLVWAMIIIAIGMTQTSGESIFGFFCRILGTFVAAVSTLITWYIVDEKVPGIFVFLFLFQAISIYFLLKFPQFIPATLLCMVTQVLIIGYELQVLKIGIALSESTGQPYYPIYKLAPYRLAIVAGGCLVAFFWTIFPSPVTERARLRRDLAVTLYLLANYFSVINETLKSKLNGTGGDRNVKGTPAHQLAKQRIRLFGKLMLLLPALKQHTDFQRWEPTIGGRFPRELYEDIIQRASRINSYLTLLSYTIGGCGKGTAGMTITDSLDAVTADTKSNLAPGNEGVESANSLRPLHTTSPKKFPAPYELTRQLEALGATFTITEDDDDDDDDNGNNSSSDASIKAAPDAYASRTRHDIHGLLDPRNMTQAGYAEFAVLQVCSLLVCDDLDGLVESVSKLVGVVDFSYCVGSGGTSTTSSGSAAASLFGSDLAERGKGKID
ncbi:hypothetical protein NUW58_g2195 [Xylaria curta]|uniref:Uncharacterized protein n=1 Tax=Xylaria curta TaxID=42375 RepID=A0ACC1PGQ7_9PEZI|nr:hypothetical protein NUW58_g2195 [Xylaria curta]